MRGHGEALRAEDLLEGGTLSGEMTTQGTIADVQFTRDRRRRTGGKILTYERSDTLSELIFMTIHAIYLLLSTVGRTLQ